MRRPSTTIHLIVFIALAIMVGAPSAHASVIFHADLTVGQEPTLSGPTNGAGQPRPIPFGFADFILNDAMTQLIMDATVFNIDVTGTQTPFTTDNLTAAHIHAGNGPAATFPVVWGFFGSPFNNNNPNDQVNTPFSAGLGGRFQGVWDAPEGNNTTLLAQLQNILAGRSYINFHTTENPGGEIRGTLQLVPEPSTLSLLGIGAIARVIVRRRRGLA